VGLAKSTARLRGSLRGQLAKPLIVGQHQKSWVNGAALPYTHFQVVPVSLYNFQVGLADWWARYVVYFLTSAN